MAFPEEAWRSADGQRLAAGEAGRGAQFLLNAEELVIFGDAVGSGGGAGLDLPRAHGHDEVGDESVLGFARAVRDDRGVSCFARHFESFDGFAYGSDLIQFDQNRVADAFGNAAGEYLWIGDEDVVAHELDFSAQLSRYDLPAIPIVLGEAILD